MSDGLDFDIYDSDANYVGSYDNWGDALKVGKAMANCAYDTMFTERQKGVFEGEIMQEDAAYFIGVHTGEGLSDVAVLLVQCLPNNKVVPVEYNSTRIVKGRAIEDGEPWERVNKMRTQLQEYNRD